MSESLLQYLPLVIILLVLIRRTQRPRRLKPGRLWIRPAVLLSVAMLYTYGAIRSGPALRLLDVAIIIGTTLAGAALGALRGHAVRLSRHPDTGDIEATLTMWGLAVVLVWIAGRFILRQMGYSGATMPFGIFTDAAMALAVGAVLTQAIVLTRRCQTLAGNPAPIP